METDRQAVPTLTVDGDFEPLGPEAHRWMIEAVDNFLRFNRQLLEAGLRPVSAGVFAALRNAHEFEEGLPVDGAGVEPATSAMSMPRSNQLS